jgi:hypothetical protein
MTVRPRRLDTAVLPFGLKVALVLIALLFAGLWAQRHGYLGSAGLREALRTDVFRLRHVDFIGLQRVSPAELFALAKVAPGAKLFDLDAAAIARALATHPRVTRVRIAVLPPDRLVVSLTERVPVAVDAGSAQAIDAGGERFPLLPGEVDRLPLLAGEPKRALAVLAAARAAGVNLASVAAPKGAETEARAVGQPVRLVIGSDPRAALADWRQLAETEVLAQTGAREVDLRFKSNPVLRDFPKSTGGENGATR